MPYSPPTGNSVNFNFLGVTYTPPLGGAANFNFQDSVTNNLTGVQGVGAAGSLAVQVLAPLAGAFGTGLINSFTEVDFGASLGLPGATASGLANDFGSVEVEGSLSGVFCTGQIGILAAANAAVPLDPVFCTGVVGTLTAASGLGQVFGTGAAGTLGKEIDVPLAGVFCRAVAGLPTVAHGSLFPTTATGTGVANDFGISIEGVVSVLLVGVSGQGVANDFVPNVTSLPQASCQGVAGDFVRRPRVFQSGVPVITAGM